MTKRYLHNSPVPPVEFKAMARRKRTRYIAVGMRLKAAREAKKLTQVQLGELCGWGSDSQSRVSNYERGDRDASLGDLLLMAKFLDLPLTWFLLGEHYDQLDEREYKLLNRFRKMNEKQRQAMTDLAESISPDPDKRE